jgi:hypothetical protein
MRKLALLTVILLTVCLTGVFAELTGIGAPTASGSATVIVGYDLDNSGFGFKNSSSLTLTMPLADGSAGASGDDGMYGEITVDEIAWSIEDGKGFYDADEDDTGGSNLKASITAALHIDPLVITIYDKPDFAINKVDVGTDYAVDAKGDVTGDTGGLSIGYVSDMISVTGMIASKGDYRDASDVDAEKAEDKHVIPFNNDVQDEQDAGDEVLANNPADFAFGATATIKPMDDITVDIAFMMDPKTSEKYYSDKADADSDGETDDGTAAIKDTELMAFGANISVALDPLTLTIPVDFVSYTTATDTKSGFEVDPTVAFEIMENLTLDANFLYGSYTKVAAADIDTKGAAAVGDIGAVGEVGLTVTDAGAFMDGLEWTVAFALKDLMNYLNTDPKPDTQWDLDVDVEYTTGGLTPYINFGYDELGVLDLGLGAKLGAEFTGLDNTCITIDYTNEALTDKKDTTDTSEKGRITCDVTVSF